MAKVGIFSGTFDPVHKGHIAFALEAAEMASLDKVYFLPESTPWRKSGVTHYAHRVAMLRLATKPYNKLDLLELPDKKFTVNQTLPRLEKRFKNDQIYMLMGSDVAEKLDVNWPGIERLLSSTKIVVGVRADLSTEAIALKMRELVPSNDFFIVKARENFSSSSEIRQTIAGGEMHDSALQLTEEYIKKNWLYVSIAP